MRCSVQNCTNDTKKTPKRRGITFHRFPKEPNLRDKWVEALGLMDWNPKYCNFVCSEHFKTDDLCEWKLGSRKVVNGAVPVLVQDSGEDFNSSGILKVCRICLATDRKLYHIIDYKLDLLYQEVTGLMISEEDNLPQKLCWECAHRLVSCLRFRRKAVMSHGLMTDMLKTRKRLTIKCLKTYSKSIYGLSSTLQRNNFDPNYCDVHINDDDSESQSYTVDVTYDNLTIKNEINDKIFINEDNIKMKEEINEININIGLNENMVDENESNVVNSIDEFLLNNTEIEHAKFNDVVKVEFTEDNEGITASEDDVIDPDVSIMEEVKIDKDANLFDYDSSESDGEKDFSIIQEKAIKVETVSKDKNKKQMHPSRKRAKKKKIEKKKNEKEGTGDPLLDENFNIKKLTLEEQKEEILRRKDSEKYKNALFKCDICYRGFAYDNKWESHNTWHSKENGDYECPVCKIRFMTKRGQKHHTNKHSETFSCKRCNFVTKHREVAKKHLGWHEGIKHKCSRCPLEFDNRNSYLSHLRIKHVADFVCELCGYAFLNKRGVVLHKRLNHKRNVNTKLTLDGPYCEVCEVRFASETAYDTHLKVSSKHSTDGDPNRIRNDCSNKDPHDTEKTSGQKTGRSKSKLIECELCGVQLHGMVNYMNHFKWEHPDKSSKCTFEEGSVMCDQCGKIFQSKALLLDHMWVHTGEKRFKCSICGKSFSQNSSLTTHRKIHSEKPPVYDCKICGKVFSRSSNRYRHMSVHNGLTYKCNLCEKSFTSIAGQRLHYNYVHLKKPWPTRSRTGKNSRTTRGGPSTTKGDPIDVAGDGQGVANNSADTQNM